MFTWQRERSHHSICHCWKPHDAHELRGCISYRTGVIADWSFTLREQGCLRFFAPMTLTLTRWPSYTNLTLTTNQQWKCNKTKRINVFTIHELRIIRLIIRGLRLTETAAATVAKRLPPKYMYVSRIRCFTMSGHILHQHPFQNPSVFLAVSMPVNFQQKSWSN